MDVEELVENEIIISLAISEDEELAEIEDSKKEDKVREFSQNNDLDFEFCQELIKKYKISLLKLGKILEALRKDQRYKNIGNLPYIANEAFKNEYSGDKEIDKVLMAGYLQNYFMEGNQKVFLNDFSDRIIHFKRKCKKTLDNTEILNCYMQFIYSTLEYYIMPIVNIGIEIKERYSEWNFGENVIESLEDCKSRYYTKTYGGLNVDELTESQRLILSAMKDYGMTGSLKNISVDILDEIERRLNVRYSTIDVLRAIDYLAQNSLHNKPYFVELKKKYLI